MLITGTRKGIGEFLTKSYLQRGFVICGCSRKSSNLKHENYLHFELDVSDEKAVVAMVRAIKAKFGKIDILINNAGIAAMNHSLSTPFSSLEKVFKTNVFGSFLFLREVAKLMSLSFRRQKTSLKTPFKIVNFTTIATPLKLEGEAIYAASKASIISLTQICAKELAPFGVSVNAVGPTPIQTDLIKNVPQNKLNELLEKQALKSFGKFEDVLNVIDFFIDEKSDFITGQTLFLGGVQ